MLAYLSKKVTCSLSFYDLIHFYFSLKISVPNDTQVTSLSWHAGEGWLAVGGDNGLLRVLKLEVQQEGQFSQCKR